MSEKVTKKRIKPSNVFLMVIDYTSFLSIMYIKNKMKQNHFSLLNHNVMLNSAI